MQTRVWVGFSVLCLLAGSEWIVDLALPHFVPGLFGLAIRFLVLALLFTILSQWTAAKHLSPRLAFWGALFLVPLPAAFAGANGHVSTLTEFLALAFLPVSIAFFPTQVPSSGQSLQQLLPALAGAGGAALLIAYTIPGTMIGRIWLFAIAAAVLLTGLAAVRVHDSLQAVASLPGAASVFSGAALLSFLLSPLFWNTLTGSNAHSLLLDLGRTLFLDAPIAFLTVWTLRCLAPARFSAKYLLILLIALAESFLIAHAGLDWSVGLGSALMLGASWSLLRPQQDPSASISLLKGP